MEVLRYGSPGCRTGRCTGGAPQGKAEARDTKKIDLVVAMIEALLKSRPRRFAKRTQLVLAEQVIRFEVCHTAVRTTRPTADLRCALEPRSWVHRRERWRTGGCASKRRSERPGKNRRHR